MLMRHFSQDKKILIITEFYPFFLVGNIENVTTDYIWVKAQFGVPLPLRNKVFSIRRDSISAFFIENEFQKIPEFNNEGVNYD